MDVQKTIDRLKEAIEDLNKTSSVNNQDAEYIDRAQNAMCVVIKELEQTFLKPF